MAGWLRSRQYLEVTLAGELVAAEVPREAASEPSILESITGLTQILFGLLRRHPEKIHFVKRGDDGTDPAELKTLFFFACQGIMVYSESPLHR